MIEEPSCGQSSDLVQCAWLLEEMAGTGNDLDFTFTTELADRLSIHGDNARVISADNQ